MAGLDTSNDTSAMKVAHLGHDNYFTWSTKVQAILEYRGLWSAITTPAAATCTEDAKVKARAFIKLHVEEWLLPTIANKNAKEAWDALKARSQATTTVRKSTLKSKLAALKMAPGEPLTKFIGRAQALSVEMAALEMSVKEEDIALAILHGLPNTYATIRTIIEATTTSKLTIDDLYGKLLSVEQQLGTQKEELALFANQHHHGNGNRRYDKRSNTTKDPCYYCAKPGHHKKDCRSFARDKQENKVHPDRATSSRNAGTSGRTNNNNPNATNNNDVRAFTALESVPNMNDWTMDSGASTNMTPDLADFEIGNGTFTFLDPPTAVTFGNGITGQAMACGTAIARC